MWRRCAGFGRGCATGNDHGERRNLQRTTRIRGPGRISFSIELSYLADFRSKILGTKNQEPEKGRIGSRASK
jgi:hypothetical protein